jgi:hypothetical protein
MPVYKVVVSELRAKEYVFWSENEDMAREDWCFLVPEKVITIDQIVHSVDQVVEDD